MALVAVLLLLPLSLFPSLLDLLLLLLDQEPLHRIVVVVLAHQNGQLPLSRKHRPRSRRLLLFLTTVLHRLPLPAQHILPPNLELLPVLVVPQLVPRMIHAHHAPAHVRAAEVVHREVGAALVLVLEPAEALGLARLLVAHELQEGRLAELGEDGDDVALGELVGEAAEVDVGRVSVVDVP